MKVKELIAALQNENPDAEVLLSYEYGDHWDTTVAQPVHEAGADTVVWSDYHGTWRVPEWDEEREGRTLSAVVLASL